MRTLDPNGQPPSYLNAGLRARRAIHEMLGLCKGLLADGIVTAEEARFLSAWVDANPEATDSWPGSVIADRLRRIYSDGRVDSEEQNELGELLMQVSGGALEHAGPANPTTQLPLDDPPPNIVFDGRVFVFTGRFLFGTRRQCESKVTARGGRCRPSVTRRMDYLVIGDLGSRDWIHTSFGRKIQKAVEYRDQPGVPLAIVHERDWAAQL